MLIRRHLTSQAQKAAVGVFTQNLRRVLLTPAITGKVVLGIDPGYKNGCKIAIINKLGIMCMIGHYLLTAPKCSLQLT